MNMLLWQPSCHGKLLEWTLRAQGSFPWAFLRKYPYWDSSYLAHAYMINKNIMNELWNRHTTIDTLTYWIVAIRIWFLIHLRNRFSCVLAYAVCLIYFWISVKLIFILLQLSFLCLIFYYKITSALSVLWHFFFSTHSLFACGALPWT